MGYTMPNLGSITEQSVAGAIATSTHGSSLRHGLLSESVEELELMLTSGRLVKCSMEHNVDLFRAALVSQSVRRRSRQPGESARWRKCRLPT